MKTISKLKSELQTWLRAAESCMRGAFVELFSAVGKAGSKSLSSFIHPRMFPPQDASK